jgi:hypothetical protein
MRVIFGLILLGFGAWVATHRSLACDDGVDRLHWSNCDSSIYPAKGAFAPSLLKTFDDNRLVRFYSEPCVTYEPFAGEQVSTPPRPPAHVSQLRDAPA